MKINVFLKGYFDDIKRPLQILAYFFGCGFLMSFYFFYCLYPEAISESPLEILNAPLAFPYLIIEMCLLAFCVCLIPSTRFLARLLRFILALLIVTIEVGQFFFFVLF